MSKSRQKDVSYFENWLKQNKPNIGIIKWNGAKNNSTFKDMNTGKEFEYKFCRLRDLFNRNPNAIPCSNKEEKLRGIENLTKEQKSEARKKAAQTCIEKYGVDNPSKYPDIAKKISEKNSSNFSFLEKSRKTMVEKYGEVSPLKIDIFKDKQLKTVFEKYGVSNVSQSNKIKQKKVRTKIKNGNIILINGKQIKELAKEKNLSYSKVQSDLKKGIREELIVSKSSGIEQTVRQFLTNLGVEFCQNKTFENFRPDFHISNHNLIIECDGLYWHSDKIRTNNSYHKIKKQFYDSNGCSSLFFREDEILNKFERLKREIMFLFTISNFYIPKGFYSDFLLRFFGQNDFFLLFTIGIVSFLNINFLRLFLLN